MEESFVGVDLPGRATRSFDPQFTADMSRRMQIPERIALTEPTTRVPVAPQQESHQLAASMVVPEKILVQSQADPFISSTFTASDEYERYDDQLQEERASQASGFETPPRRIPVPNAGAVPSRVDTQPGGAGTQRELSFSDKNEQQQIDTLRKQIVSMSRRLTALENNEQRRAKMDMVLYSLLSVYVAFRIGNWLTGKSNRY